jgi:hypothetical protein
MGKEFKTRQNLKRKKRYNERVKQRIRDAIKAAKQKKGK